MTVINLRITLILEFNAPCIYGNWNIILFFRRYYYLWHCQHQEVIVFHIGRINSVKISARAKIYMLWILFGFFKFCDYSYNDLLNVLDSLNRYLAKTPYDGLNFRHFGLRNIKNRIEVSLIEYNEDRMKDFKQHVHNSPLITFVQGEGVLELHSPLNPGSNIDISQTTADNDGPFGSIGYRAKDANGVTGIVTAGHAFKQNANVLRDGKIIGVANNSYMSGAIDAAFCEIFDSAYTLTNTLYLTGEELSTEILEPTTGGTTINKIGYKTKRTSGKIIDAFDTFDDRPGGGVIYYGVVSATYTSDKGDSGGIVYLYNSGTNKRYTLGIHIGRSGNKAYYSKANAINRHFKIQRY